MSFQRPKGLVVFHRSGVMDCPYLEGNREQQLFTELSGKNSQKLFERLSHAGFRRSHQIIYRPTCPGCDACKSVRIPVTDFKWSKSWKRVLKKNDDLTIAKVGLKVSAEQYRLFNRYIRSRHGDGEMASMTERDYLNLVLASPVDSSMFEFRDSEGILKAACLADFMTDGLSAVYSFFDPDLGADSLGSYIILSLIQWAQQQNVSHVYLGFWVPGSPKMAYKERFKPLEVFGHHGWKRLPAEKSEIL